MTVRSKTVGTPVPAPTVTTGTTLTGLDALVRTIVSDPGLLRNVPGTEIDTGALAADRMNALIIEAAKAVGAKDDGTIHVADVRAMNEYIRANHLAEWTELHGDDEGKTETGFHLVQDDGATSRLFGKNAVNTVADGLYHLGFEIKGNNFRNEDGNANASVQSVAFWLDELLKADDLATGASAVTPTTGTGLDRLVDTITGDEGLKNRISLTDIKDGAAAANRMNEIIIEAIKAVGAADDGTIHAADVRAMNEYIRANHLAEWTELHGDDEGKTETGFHLVQDDGATSRLFGKNAVNTVADGLYHLGFEIKGNNFRNEDGNANASVKTVAYWLDELLADDKADLATGNGTFTPTTGTGLDALVEIITSDEGLKRKISLTDILNGAEAANRMNEIILEAIEATGVNSDQTISSEDALALNAYIRANHLAEWTELHGDDENCEETGFHLVQNDGSESFIFGRDAIDTVADGIYHLGFEVKKGQFLNEDGNANASVSKVALWLNALVNGEATGDDVYEGNKLAERLFGGEGRDYLSGEGGNDSIFGGVGDDTIIGGKGSDLFDGGAGKDLLVSQRDGVRDTFVFRPGDTGVTAETADQIKGFAHDQDLIDLKAFGLLTFVAGGAFTGAGNEVAFKSGQLMIDDGGAAGEIDALILLTGVKTFDAGDLILA